MNWLYFVELLYPVLVVLVGLRIVYDTRGTTKTLAYLLLVVFVPVAGIIFYFFFGINYRKRKMYSKKLVRDDGLRKQLREEIMRHSKEALEQERPELRANRELATMLMTDSHSPVTQNNEVKLLVNGEDKFPVVIEALKKAKHHIHLEYYIYEDEEIGREIAAILIQKKEEGVSVRFIYDDFGSHSIRGRMSNRLAKAGVEVFPFSRVYFMLFANRINYRNHRKIIVIDGCVGFVGGINVSDRYVNNGKQKDSLFWRDTHLRIEGPGVHYLQYLFLCDWNFCADQQLERTKDFFPPSASLPVRDNKLVQIAASGPDSDSPTILYSMLQAINLATEEILITTPYFIPGESIQDALIVSALGGVKVKLLVPNKSDSRIVNAAARCYYGELLTAGVEIYLYNKGFVHAKTMCVDRMVAIVGTANMDYRSFELNFEVNAIVYDAGIADQLAKVFEADILEAEKIDAAAWNQRSNVKVLLERTAKLVSPFL